MTRMSESYYPSPDSFPSDVSSTATAQRSRGPQLGLACVAVGLGILLGIVVAALIFVLVGIGSAAGWSAIGAVGFVIGAAFTALAVSSYRRPEPVRWWQILGFSFGVGLLVNSINRAARAEPVSVIVGILNAASLVLLIVGGIVAVIQTSAKPAAKPPQGALVAPIVGHTADGRPVYGQPIQGTSGLPQPTNVFAVLALVFGIIGGLLGIVFGHVALSQIRRTGEAGRGMAIAGLALGYAYLAVILMGLIGLLIFEASY